jgi:hypothetical protein
VKTSWKPPYGERSEIPDRFREETIALAPSDHSRMKFSLSGPSTLVAILIPAAKPRQHAEYLGSSRQYH